MFSERMLFRTCAVAVLVAPSMAVVLVDTFEPVRAGRVSAGPARPQEQEEAPEIKPPPPPTPAQQELARALPELRGLLFDRPPLQPFRVEPPRAEVPDIHEPEVVPNESTPGPTFRLSSILTIGGESQALINGKPYAIGAEIEPGWKVSAIDLNQNAVEVDGGLKGRQVLRLRRPGQ